MYFVYILQSQVDNGYYFGHTSNPEQRLLDHNRGKVKSTRGRRPFLLHYYEIVGTKSEACQREMYFKTLEGRKWLIQNKIITAMPGR